MEKFAPGIHLLVDYWGVAPEQSAETIEQAFRQAVIACGATLLNIQFHSFGENAGVTGVAMLAESHMSIHSWPELDYMAIDIFMCGDSNPHMAEESLRHFFKPLRSNIVECRRGSAQVHSQS